MLLKSSVLLNACETISVNNQQGPGGMPAPRCSSTTRVCCQASTGELVPLGDRALSHFVFPPLNRQNIHGSYLQRSRHVFSTPPPWQKPQYIPSVEKRSIFCPRLHCHLSPRQRSRAALRHLTWKATHLSTRKLKIDNNAAKPYPKSVRPFLLSAFRSSCIDKVYQTTRSRIGNVAPRLFEWG